MLFLCIYLAIFVLILFRIVFNYHERKFEQDLLSDKSLEKFRKIKVSRLELKRYVKNTYLGSNINMILKKKYKKYGKHCFQKFLVTVFSTTKLNLTEKFN